MRLCTEQPYLTAPAASPTAPDNPVAEITTAQLALSEIAAQVIAGRDAGPAELEQQEEEMMELAREAAAAAANDMPVAMEDDILELPSPSGVGKLLELLLQ